MQFIFQARVPCGVHVRTQSVGCLCFALGLLFTSLLKIFFSTLSFLSSPTTSVPCALFSLSLSLLRPSALLCVLLFVTGSILLIHITTSLLSALICSCIKRISDMIWGPHVFTYEEQREYLHACFSDKYALVQERILLGQPVDFKDEEGRTAMYLAAVESNSDIVKFLLENKGALFHLSNACARSEAAAGLKRLMRFFFGFDSSF